TGTTDDKGNFEVTTDPIKPGDKVNVEVTDKAGNKGNGEGTAGNLTHPNDHTAPSEPTITFVEDTNPKDGKLNKAENDKDGDNANTTAKISIPADAVVNDVIKYTVNGGKEESHTITNADKTAGHVEIKVPVVDGQTSTITAKIVDQAGNESKAVSGSIDSDFTAPNVKITGIIDNVEGGVYKGNVAGTNTNDNKPTIKGTADANQEVVLYDNNKEMGRVTADKDGNWEFKPSDYKEPLADLVGRVHVIKAVVTDAAGNTSEATSALEVDTTIGAPKVSIKEDADHNGVLSVDEAKNLKDSKIHWEVEIPKDGTVSAGDVLQVLGKDGKWKTEKVLSSDDLGKSFEYEATLSGKHFESPSYRIVDLVGNQSTAIHANVQLDSEFSRQPSNPSITFPEDNDPKDGKISDKENKAGDKDAGKTTAEVIIPQDGSVKPGDKLVVTDENGKQTEKIIGQGDIDKGSIDVPVDLNPGKDNTIIAEIVNPNNPDNPGKGKGVIGENSEATKAPEAPVITDVIDDVEGGKFNQSVKGGLTNDNTPTIKGTAKAGSTVVIYDNGVEIGRIENANANWDFTTPVLTKQGEHKFTAIAENKFGKSAPSNEATIDLDTKAPVIDRITITPVDTSNPADSTAELTNVTGHTDTPKADLVFKDASGKVIGSGKANNTGGFLITDVEGVKPGDKITVEATDKAGNTSVTEVTAGEMIHPNDHTAPSEPTITFVEDTNPKDGKLNKAENDKDGDNANTTAKISIPADAVVNDVIKYTVNGGKEESHTITNADKTAGHVEIKVPVVDGQTSTITAKIVDQAGNESKAVSGSVDSDFTAPNTPAITAVIDEWYGGVEFDNVLGKDKGLTNDNTPKFKGTAEAGSTIVLKNGNEIIGEDIEVKANGTWEFTPKTPLADGEYNVTATATDNAGNVSNPSNVATINVDTNCAKPVITEIIDDVAGGVVNGDVKFGLTNDSLPTLKGTAEPFAEVKFMIDGRPVFKDGKQVSVTADENGKWEYTLEANSNWGGKVHAALEDGRHTFEAQATDKAGNNSQPSALVSVDFDTTAGAPKVMITADADDNNILTATEASSITDGKLKWVIKLPEDAKEGDRIEMANSHREWVTILTLSAADIAKGEVARDDFSADFVKGKPGFETPSYRIVDQAGNVSTEHWDTVKFDKTAPASPVIKEVIDDVKGYEKDTKVGNVLDVKGGLTNDNMPTIKGTAEAGIKVNIYDNGKWIGDAKADANGNWNFTPSTSAALPDGKHSITAVAENALGVNSEPSNAANIDVDTVTPKPTIEKITDNVEGGVYHGDVKGGLTNDNRPVFEGKAEKGAFVELIDNGKVIGTTEAGEDGKWTIQPKEPMADGRHDMVVQATDLAGNRSRSDQSSSDVETNAGVVKITAVCDDVAGYNGKVGNILGVNNGLTNDSTPTIKGTAKPGTTITIKDGNSVIDGVIKYNGDGSWEFTPKTPFADGEHKLTAIATSRTSGAQSVSNVATIDIDTTIRIELTEVTPIAEGGTPGAHISKPTINFNTISGGNYVSQGDKSDYVKVNNWVSNCANIDLGNGNDTLAIGGLVENGVVINAGRGNDKITIGEYLKGSLVDLGEGGANIVRTRIAGISDEINAAFIIKDKNDVKIGEGKTDADGKFDMFIDKAIKPGEKLSVEIVDAAGNKASDSRVASHIEVSGVRYHDNELDVGTNIDAATVVAGNGNDLVIVGEEGKPDGYITGESKIELGGGDNEIRVRTNIDHSEIKTGSGDDIVTTGLGGRDGYILNANGEYSIDLGNGNNKLTVGTNIQNSEIKTGSGDDVVNVGVNGIGGYIRGHSIVELGAGNDLLNVRTYIDHSTVDTGAGNDVVKVGSYIHSSKVDLGAGDDTLSIGKVDLNNSKVDGGAGYDKLVLENPDKSVNLSDISKFAKNFEELDISGSKNTTLKVGIKDVLDMTDDKHTLKITGDKGDVVDLKEDVKGSGWHQGASEDGYTTYTNNTVTIQIKDEIHVI
ncbi:Ig-like domain-containing protein, partial [Campylobacter concisus]|uniref:Ig-like domain-containing protein n=1 Tax=Campylobacter concisus TaxID=199 RepID=UPI00112FB7A6